MKRLPGGSIGSMTSADIERAQDNPASGPLADLKLGTLDARVTTEDRRIPGPAGQLTVRIYTPMRRSDRARPLVFAIHGGGWVLGDLRGIDWLCSTVSADLDAVVVSIAYRLAPKHPFPAALDDCYMGLEWCATNAADLGADPTRLGVMGDSAGGNLSAVLCLLARDRSGPVIRHQALIYPATDASITTPSRLDNADAPILTAADVDVYVRLYVGDSPTSDWRVSPARAASHAALPPALIQVAGHDPLHDDGVIYAGLLRSAGVPVTFTEYPAMVHGFISFPRFSRDAKRAVAEVVSEQRRWLTSPPSGD